MDMELKIKAFEELSLHELYEIMRVRCAVFVVEQECVYQDIDGIDERAVHVFYEHENSIYGYLRLFYKDDDHRTVQIGRVLSTEQGVQYAIETMKAETLYLEAQTYAIGFYQREGFEIVSDEFLEDGIPHVKMIRHIQQKELHNH